MERSADIFKRVVEGGVAAIDDFIESRQSEELFLDFKRSSDNGVGPRLSQIDRNNLSKAISGFGNSEGGVIIWGVDCAPDDMHGDVANSKVPITNVRRFVSWLEGAVAGCTIPPHKDVVHHAIADTNDNGYVITHVPKSYDAPHQVVGKLQYYIRAGSNFVPTPHMVLAGMFGRVIPPHVFHHYITAPARILGRTIHCQLGLLIGNQGPGLAFDLYASVKVWSLPGVPCELSFEIPDQSNFTGRFAFGRFCSVVSNVGVRIAPESQAQAMTLNIAIAEPINDGIDIEGVVGSSSHPPYRFRIGSEQEGIQQLYDETMAAHIGGQDCRELLKEFCGRLLRLGRGDTGDES